MWVLQPLVIELLLSLWGDDRSALVLVAKVSAIGLGRRELRGVPLRGVAP
ncbi:hypothetical protein [Nocardioides ungokensis]|nr:hypothetical protein [Nocardioides ungokensis]